MNHRILRSGLFAAVVLALTACGSSAPATTAPTNPPAATAVPTAIPEPTAAPTVVVEPTGASSESGSTTATTPDGWGRFEVKGEGFAVNLPPNWEQVDLNSGDVAKSVSDILARTGNTNDSLQSQVEAMAASGIKFYGFDTSKEGTSNGITTNINVIKQKIGTKVPLDAIEQANIQQIKDVLKVENVDSSRVTLPAGEAIKLVYSPEMQVTADKKITTALTQYILLSKANDLYVISLTAAPDQADTYTDVFEQIGQSFEVSE